MSEEEKINQPTEDSQPSTEENKAVAETSGNNKKPITNMEVHHHPHVEKKNFKEYFLEFLMIFLAVTMGFFAESYREHISERAKEKEYMHSLSTDLESDSALINYTIIYNTTMYKADSTILHLLQRSNKNSKTLDSIYKLYPATTNFDTQINDPKTIEQLKSTGDYRLIKNKAVLDSIAKYYQYIAVTRTFRDEIQSQLQLTYNLSFKIFDLYSFDNNAGTPAGLTNDATLLKEYTNKLYNLATNYKMYNIFLQNIRSKSIVLNQLIKKEYHLEKSNP